MPQHSILWLWFFFFQLLDEIGLSWVWVGLLRPPRGPSKWLFKRDIIAFLSAEPEIVTRKHATESPSVRVFSLGETSWRCLPGLWLGQKSHRNHGNANKCKCYFLVITGELRNRTWMRIEWEKCIITAFKMIEILAASFILTKSVDVKVGCNTHRSVSVYC